MLLNLLINKLIICIVGWYWALGAISQPLKGRFFVYVKPFLYEKDKWKKTCSQFDFICTKSYVKFL